MERKKESFHKSNLKGKTILIINGMLKPQRFILEVIKKLGLTTVVVDVEPNYHPKRLTDYQIQANTNDYREVIDRIQIFKDENPEIKIDGAITFWEQDTPILAKVCEHFHYIGNSHKTAVNTRNKYEMRKRLKDTGLGSPEFHLLKNERDLTKAIATIGFPAVMKPICGSDSEFVVLVKSEEEAFTTYDYLKKNATGDFSNILQENKGLFLYEEYVDGTEISLECFVQYGIPHVVAMNEKAPMTPPYFIECGDIVPPRLPKEDLDEAVKLAESALIALGVKNSLGHIEMKLSSKGPKIIEVGSRMGLDDIYLYAKKVWNEDLIKIGLQVALGEKVEVKKRESNDCIIARYFIPPASGIITKVSNVDEAKKLPNVLSLMINKDVGDVVLVPPEGFETIGWVATYGKTYQEAQYHLDQILNTLDINVTKFSKGSSLGLSIEPDTFSSASALRNRIIKAARIEKIRTIDASSAKNLHIGIITNSELPLLDDSTKENPIGEDIKDMLIERGYRVSLFDMNEAPLPIHKIEEARLDFVFNLCEALHNSLHLESHAAALMDVLQIPFSGSKASTLSLCVDKILVKKLFEYHEIPTPAWDYAYSVDEEINPELRYPLIVKPADTDNSYGITSESVVTNKEELLIQLDKVINGYGRPALIEEFIDGDEFDACLIGNEENVRVLPLMRSIFNKVPEGCWPIYGSDEREDFEITLEKPAKIPEKLSNLLKEIALDCFSIFDLYDYGKVEFRVDKDGNPYVLEVNPNPPIGVDYFFSMSAEAEGMDFGTLLDELIMTAVGRYKLQR